MADENVPKIDDVGDETVLFSAEPEVLDEPDGIDAPIEAEAPAEAEPTPEPYVRRQPARRSVEPIDDFAQEPDPSSLYAHDSDYESKASPFQGQAYRRSRTEGAQLRRDLQYGQYLEIPKGRRDIFVRRERKSRALTALAAIVVLAALAAVAWYAWNYMNSAWGVASWG